MNENNLSWGDILQRWRLPLGADISEQPALLEQMEIVMSSSDALKFGPNTAQVVDLLSWLDRGELLHFSSELEGSFIPVPNFTSALERARSRAEGTVNWTDVRERESSSLYDPGTLDTPQWLPYKANLEELAYIIDKK